MRFLTCENCGKGAFQHRYEYRGKDGTFALRCYNGNPESSWYKNEKSEWILTDRAFGGWW